MTKQEKKRMCSGCRNNFYNGNNPYGVKECWNFKTSRVVLKKKVPIWLEPPWDMEPQKVLSCRHEKGYVFVDKNVKR